MPGQLSNREKQDRVHRLEAVDARGNAAYRKSLTGLDSTVLWERRNEAGFWEGFTPGYVRVYCRDPRENLEGIITPVHLENLFEDGLLGVIINN